MMNPRQLSKAVMAAIGLAPTAVLAALTITNDRMTSLLNAGGLELATLAQPMWFFGQSQNRVPCYPTQAVDSNLKQTPAGALCAHPNVGCNCRNPGVPIGNPGPSFPVYYSYQKCSDSEVRIAYNLFYEKDGVVLTGHGYDWERVIVIWRQTSGSWTPATALLSAHSGYNRHNWGDIQNTFNTADATLPIGGDNGRKNLDHPKVYVGWSKHPQFHDRNTGFNDVLSQSTNNAFRSQDWWYYPQTGDYVRADRSTTIGQTIANMNWGDATSNPASVHDGLCSA